LLLIALLAILPPALPAQSGGHYHSVTRTESVASLAARLGIPATRLASANRVTTSTQLKKGSKIWVPARTPAARPTPKAGPKVSSKPTKTAQKSASVTKAPASKKVASAAAKKPALSGDEYQVQPGDTLSGVAKRFGLTASSLASLNGISSNAGLIVGQRLLVRASESAESTPGGGIPPRTAEPPAPAPAATTSTRSARPSSKGFIWPLEGRIVRRFTSNQQEKYTGIDIAAPRGTEVRASRDGVVVYASDVIPYYGRMVIVEHSGGMASCYAQLERILVNEGQRLKMGQVVGRSGDPGKGRGPFLHYEIRRGGEAVNPEPYLP
jgi:LysM repeat protein